MFGMPAFDSIGRDPELSALFNKAMAETAQGAADVVAAGYDFSGVPTVVDVGGGNGTLLGALLTAHPDSRGVLFDTPTGVREAAKVLADAGVADRCEITTGDFFTSVPGGGDAYVLKSVIHDWDDDLARTVLRRCREAMPDHAKAAPRRAGPAGRERPRGRAQRCPERSEHAGHGRRPGTHRGGVRRPARLGRPRTDPRGRAADTHPLPGAGSSAPLISGR
ncbi:methyltransferase [Streptomyces sp. P17]|nr:methyltransferase [Streptomyces sp. P17]MDT9695806.1 methyltransferase [Streptomyces sp. P17]